MHTTAPAPECATALSMLGVDVLAGPRWATGTGIGNEFDQVRAELTPGQFGTFGPLDDLQPRWDGLESSVAAELQDRAEHAGARMHLAYPGAYNGVLPRLVGWHVEQPDSCPERVLVLHVQRTTFATWLVTNGDPALPEHLRAGLSRARQGLAVGAHHLPLAVAVVTRDGFIILTQRASGMAVHPDLFGSAVGGNVDLQAHAGGPADVTPSGVVDVVGAAQREASEELGAGIDVTRENLEPLALVRYTDVREWAAPLLVFRAVSQLSLGQILQGLRYAHPTEGVGELGRHLLAVPVRPADPAATVAFLLGECSRGTLTTPALVSTLLALGEGASSAALGAGGGPHMPRVRPAEILRVPTNVSATLGIHPVGY